MLSVWNSQKSPAIKSRLMAEVRIKKSALSSLPRGTPAMGLNDNNSTARSITILPMEAIRTLAYTKRRLHQGKRGKPCVYCGAAPGTTMDHVFAETLFDPVPPDALTVPACEPCNQIKAVGDEALHIVITVATTRCKLPPLWVISRKSPGQLNVISHLLRPRRGMHSAYEGRLIRYSLGVRFHLPLTAPRYITTLKMAVRGSVFKVHGRILPASMPRSRYTAAAVGSTVVYTSAPQ